MSGKRVINDLGNVTDCLVCELCGCDVRLTYRPVGILDLVAHCPECGHKNRLTRLEGKGGNELCRACAEPVGDGEDCGACLAVRRARRDDERQHAESDARHLGT